MATPATLAGSVTGTAGRIGSVGNSASSGSSENNGRPFFSRRLGLSPTGTPVDLQLGGKLSGRVGPWNIGFLTVRQDGFGSIEESTVLVGRASANVLRESTLGMIVTAGDPSSNRDNAVVGVDFRYLNSRLPGGRVIEGDAWAQRSDTEGLDGDEAAFGAGIRLPNNSGLRGSAYLKEIQANFNPAVGFVSRSNVRDVTGGVGYRHFTGGSFLQSIFSGVDVQRVNVLDGGLQSQIVLGRLVEIESNAGESLSVHYSATKEAVARPFTIYDDDFREVVVPPGTYSFGETLVSVETAGQRELSGGLTYSWGDFYNGSRRNIGGEISWVQSRRFGMGLNYDWNDIDLPQGSFITRLLRLTTDVNFSSTLYWINLVQYDNVSEVLGVNSRLRWIPRAGQEGLIVLNHSLQDRNKDGQFVSELNDIAVKLSYTFRF